MLSMRRWIHLSSMVNKMMYTLLLVFSSLIFFPASVFAMTASQIDYQDVVATINPDFSATGLWTLQVDLSHTNSAYGFGESDDFGSTGMMSYRVKNISDENGEHEIYRTPDYVSILRSYKSGSGVRNIFVTYDIATVLKKPIALYEFWIADGSYFRSPRLKVNFPVGWKVLSVWPPAEISDSSLSVSYPKDFYGGPVPVVVAFVPTDSGFDNEVKKVGRFTLVGSSTSVRKLDEALSRMTFLDNLFANSLGWTLPEDIIIYSSDLAGADVGYEVEALVARPNIILYNDDFLGRQSFAEIQNILVHEITHVAELQQKLFRTGSYVAPWFREGLAVFMENQARSYIFKDEGERAIADISKRTHLMNSSELFKKYSYPFDYLFQGYSSYTVYDSYTHGGVILTNFFNKVGVEGMRKFFELLKSKDSVSNKLADSDLISNTMASTLGVPNSEITFPYKISPTYETEIKGLVRPEYEGAAIDSFVAYVKEKVPSYIDGRSAAFEIQASKENVIVETAHDFSSVPKTSLASTSNNFSQEVIVEAESIEVIKSSDVSSTSPEKMSSTKDEVDMSASIILATKEVSVREPLFVRFLKWFRGVFF